MHRFSGRGLATCRSCYGHLNGCHLSVIMAGQVSDSEAFFTFFETRLFFFFLVFCSLTLRLPYWAYKSQVQPCVFVSAISLLELSFFFTIRSSPALLFLKIFLGSSFSYKMPKDGNDYDGLGEAHPALWESKLSRVDERRVRSECFILKFIKIWFDEEKSGTVVRSDCHEACVYETMFKVGFRLSFLPVVREFLGYLDLAPHQIAPNSWKVFHSYMVLWPLALGNSTSSL